MCLAVPARADSILPTILHQDDDLIVVDKPPRITSVPGRGGRDLSSLLRGNGLIGLDDELLVVHRLDRGASGVIVFARTPDAQRNLSEQWSARTVEKVYLALVAGHLRGEGSINVPLRIERDRGLVEIDRRKGRQSLTRYAVVEHVAGHTVVECRPVTGRLHQIRVHLKSIGHPLAVDSLYGSPTGVMLSQFKRSYQSNRRGEERPLIDRLTLHAQRLSFDHPKTGEHMTIEAPLPKDLRVTIDQLRRAKR